MIRNLLFQGCVFSGAFAVNFRGGYGCSPDGIPLVETWEFHPTLPLSDRGVERPLQASLRFHAQQQQTMRSAGVFKSPLKMLVKRKGIFSPFFPQKKCRLVFFFFLGFWWVRSTSREISVKKSEKRPVEFWEIMKNSREVFFPHLHIDFFKHKTRF